MVNPRLGAIICKTNPHHISPSTPNMIILFVLLFIASHSYVLSAETTIVTVVGVSTSTLSAVVVISKSNTHVPIASNVTGAESGELKVIVHASPEPVPPGGTVLYSTVIS